MDAVAPLESPPLFSLYRVLETEKKVVLSTVEIWRSVSWDAVASRSISAPEKRIFRDSIAILDGLYDEVAGGWVSEKEPHDSKRCYAVLDTACKIQALALVTLFDTHLELNLLVSNPSNIPCSFVPPERQTRGAGSALIKNLQEYGKDIVVDPLDSAIPFYRNRGFERTGVRQAINDLYVLRAPRSPEAPKAACICTML